MTEMIKMEQKAKEEQRAAERAEQEKAKAVHDRVYRPYRIRIE